MQEKYEDKKILWIKRLAIISLSLLSILLFFKVYGYFIKSIQIIIGTVFPFILSFILVYTLMLFINILSEKYKMKRNMAITLVLALFFTFFIIIILIIVPLIVKQFSEFINYFNENQELIQNKALSFISENNINLKTSINNSKNAIFSNIFKFLSSGLSFVSGTFSLLFMTPIFTIMLIYSYDNIGKGIEKRLVYFKKENWLPLIKQIDHSIGKYIIVTVIDSFIMGFLSFCVFHFLKLEYSPLFAAMIGFWNAIPFIGPFIGLIPAVFYALTKSLHLAILTVVLITILQTIEGNILKPWLTSKSVSIHPITTLLVVLIGGALFGIIGAFTAIPVYIILKLTTIFYFENVKK